MGSTPTATLTTATEIKGKIVEAEVKPSVDPARPLPLVCGLYCIETAEGFWLCAYYGMNKSVFDFLPQKGTEIVESQLGITFKVREFIPRDQFAPEKWEEFKKTRFMGLKGP
jgi:hypothetical protein